MDDPMEDPVEERGEDDSSEGEESEREMTDAEKKKAAVSSFLEVLLGLYFTSSVSAETLCVLCWWASQAGLVGLENFAKKPGDSAGHYARFLDHVAGLKSGHEYHLPVHGMRKNHLARTQYNLVVRPPHECISREMNSDSTIGIKTAEAKAAGDLPPAYTEHTVVLRSIGKLVLPLALFIDGVAYALTDSVVGVWVYNYITGTRHLVALVRKHLTCRCGCRGWCTFYPLFCFLRWSFDCLAQGLFPSCRHDQSPWQPGVDDERAKLGGTSMAHCCCLVWSKGDWAEHCHFGFPTWQSNMRPCFCCNLFGKGLHAANAPPQVPSLGQTLMMTMKWHAPDVRYG